MSKDTKRKNGISKVAMATGAAIGSAAIAAALMYAGRRKKSGKDGPKKPVIPSGEDPQTD